MRMRLLPVALMAALLCIPACGGGGGGTPPAPGNALGPQLAQISVALDGTVTVTTQPSAFTLSGTAVYDAMAMTLVISLNVRNDFHRLLFNLKAITTSVSDGTQSGSTMPLTAFPYTYYGPESLDVGADRTEDITLTGVTGGVDPVVIDLSFRDAPMLFGGNYGGDFTGFDTSLSGEVIDVAFSDPSDAGDNVRQSVVSADGRFIYAGEKHTTFLTIIDTTTHTVSGGVDLSGGGGIGNVGGVALNADGSRLYVAYNDGVHYHGSADDGSSSTAEPSTLDIIEYDSSTMMELRRTNLFTANAEGLTCKWLGLSPDGSRIAAVVSAGDASNNNTLWQLDVASLAVIDADAGTMGNQGIDLGSAALSGMAEYGTWIDNTRFVVGINRYRWDSGNGAAPLIDVDTVAFTATSATLVPTTDSESSSHLTSYMGRLYYPARNGSGTPFEIFDLTGAMPVLSQPTIGTETEAHGVLIHPGGARYYVVDDAGNEVYVFDRATDTPVDTDGDAMNGITPVSVPRQIRAHFMCISPF